jgi:hypothetical protein
VLIFWTTANLARKARACSSAIDKVSAAVGGASYGADTPIGLDVVAESAGLDAALWAMGYALPADQVARAESIARLFAARCAYSVLPIAERDSPGERRPREAIRTARRFARGEATREELDAAGSAAWDAAWAAKRSAAGDAAWAAAGAAAGDAAGDAQTELFISAIRGEVDIDDFPGL